MLANTQDTRFVRLLSKIAPRPNQVPFLRPPAKLTAPQSKSWLAILVLLHVNGGVWCEMDLNSTSQIFLPLREAFGPIDRVRSDRLPTPHRRHAGCNCVATLESDKVEEIADGRDPPLRLLPSVRPSMRWSASASIRLCHAKLHGIRITLHEHEEHHFISAYFAPGKS